MSVDLMTLIRTSIAEELAVDPATISEGSAIGDDLGVDSLDVLNITFRLEQALNVKLPVEDWLAGFARNEHDLASLTPRDLAQMIEVARAA